MVCVGLKGEGSQLGLILYHRRVAPSQFNARVQHIETAHTCTVLATQRPELSQGDVKYSVV